MSSHKPSSVLPSIWCSPTFSLIQRCVDARIKNFVFRAASLDADIMHVLGAGPGALGNSERMHLVFGMRIEDVSGMNTDTRILQREEIASNVDGRFARALK